MILIVIHFNDFLTKVVMAGEFFYFLFMVVVLRFLYKINIFGF